MRILSKDRLCLMPFDSSVWESLAKWYYSEDCAQMFRHIPHLMSEEQFKSYDKCVGGEVVIIYEEDSPIGYINIAPSGKPNRGAKVGLVLEQSGRDVIKIRDIFYLMGEYVFNRLGFRKIICEVLADNVTLNSALNGLGFHFEGTLKEESFFDGKFVDECRWSMFKQDFDKFVKEYM